jgi:amino acid adenylation domain-containing protein
LVVVENYPLDRRRLAALAERTSLDLAAVRSIERTNYPLTLVVEPGAELRMRAVYDRDRFDRADALRTLRHLATLLRSLPTAAGGPAERVSMLADGERHQLLVEWNDTAALWPAVLSVHERVLRQAERTPDATAVACGDEWLTYGALAERARALAGRLHRLGVGPEVPVGLCLERGPALVVGMLGVLLAGGLYVPLDPAHPRTRRERVLADSGAEVVLSERRLRHRLGAYPGTVLFVDDTAAGEAGPAPWPSPAPAVAPDHPAYLIYPSGSTGMPNGVVVSHRAVVNFLDSMARRPGLRAHDTLLAVTTLAFDIAVLEIVLPLVLGARVDLVPHEVSIDGLRLGRELERSRATAMQATPATWRLLLDAGWPGRPGLALLCGGEALPADLAGELIPRGAALWNLYGPTETTIWSAIEPIAPAGDDGPVSVGRPIDNTRMVVVEGGGEPAPVGAAGELWIGGAGLARGYRGRPALTASRFVPDPWGPPGGRLYRTGDLARSLPDGRLEVLGRLDYQVKVRGFRVELQEIEAALAVHPGVGDAAVATWRPGGAEAVLVAYVVAAGPAPAAREIQSFLAQRLPAYMVPAGGVVLVARPRTPNR